MSDQSGSVADIRLQPTGEEAGTAPDDRSFRPDVQGLRAIAVLLVVLFHAGVPHLTGGYVGVDVFFVISGFVITGVLLRERQATGGTSIIGFYARRVRRILPAATLCILITVALSYMLLGFVTGDSVANDGRWAAVFLVNFHFTATGTDYFASHLPPSPLQNFWSLAVEEQFYVVYPTLVLVLGAVGRRFSFRARLGTALVAVIVASYAWSIVQTGNNTTAAYFSPFTRAWELALGALVALLTPTLKKVPVGLAAVASWAGLAAIMVAAFVFNGNTAYPGSLVAVPVLGTALVIAAGAVVPRFGVEGLLAHEPFGFLGRRSYSWYLWHWPILILVTEHLGKSSLALMPSLLLMLLALVVASVSYSLVENPIRHSRLSARRSVGLGLVLVAVTLAILTLAITEESFAGAPHYTVRPASLSTVLHAVAAAPSITHVPATLEPPVAAASADWGGLDYAGCTPKIGTASEPANEPSCLLGDKSGRQEMVVWGDSHSLMWLPAFKTIANRAHWRLVILGKPDCPDDQLNYLNPPGFGAVGGQYTVCNQWHQWSLDWLKHHHPSLLVITQQAVPSEFTPAQWRVGLERTLDALHAQHQRTVILGNIPIFKQHQPPAACLAAHTDDAQACTISPISPWSPYSTAEVAAAHAKHVPYIDPMPWFCSSVCTPIVGHLEVYLDTTHITAVYAKYLSTVLGQALAPSMASS